MMIKAVFFDMDNTLNQNPPFRFVRTYVTKLTRHLHGYFPHIDAETLTLALRSAIQCTIADQNPLTTNWQVFMTQFTTETGLGIAELREPLNEFYAEIYPELASITDTVPQAQELVEWLQRNGYTVVITTNPLFETSPIEQRLGWAGFPPTEWDFGYITNLNNTHFTKPHPHYFEEVMSRVGVEPEEVLMVGDDWVNDIVPAILAGMNAYWIPTESDFPSTEEIYPDVQADGQGSLAELFGLIRDEEWLDTLTTRPLTISQIEPRMLGNIAAIMGLISDVPDHFWNQRPDPNEWTPLEILVHLRDTEQTVQRPRLLRMMREDDPFLSAANPPPNPGEMDIAGLDEMQVVMEFVAEREETIAFLRDLSPIGWQRSARHSVLGPTTLLEMAAFTTRHDHLHITQLCQTLGNCE